MKKVLVFGSTGSIGKNSLDCLRKSREDFKVIGLCAYSNTRVLMSQVKEFSPRYVCVVDEKSAKDFESACDRGVTLFKGKEGLKEFSQLSSDISVMGISGISALEPLLANIRRTKRVALANKETIVCGGSFVFSQARKYKTEILPVDSEINALYQLLGSGKRFERVYLTASGGALFDYTPKALEGVSVKDVLKHPTWDMGARITIDSATLLNKGFEAIEAHNFFNLKFDDIGIVIHRESKIHALAQFQDKTILACMYPADMRIPIAFALYYPRRCLNRIGIDFSKAFSFTFLPLPRKRFPLLEMIIDAAKKEDNSLVCLNACDEKAVDYFLKKKIKFTDIYKAMDYMYGHYLSKKLSSVGDIFYWNNWASKKTEEYLKTLC
ncbi:MAG: 1-deoxy-D-xylulose-5-phosphate reductoisomerase [Candidatus Omnitrophica bacterium]|nr:1-deoxy-D-xylulose-5-phosphate reductoisomerase [Candidatus Omnitrophota bacterium]